MDAAGGRTGFDALVISGGAARGAAFLGALHRLRHTTALDNVRLVAGSSVGSLAAALVCQGADMREAMLHIAANPFELQPDLISLEPPFGIDSGEDMLVFIRSLIGTETFDQMKSRTGKTLAVCATALTEKRPVYFTAGSHPNMEVARAIRLSCSLPLLFAYGMWQGEAYVDGGLTDNFPVAPAKAAGCTRILGLRVKPQDSRGLPADLTDYVMTLMSCVAWQAVCKDDACQRVLELDVEQQALLDFSMTARTLKRLFAVGYDAANI